jgi:1-deoxy-D-xylulose-5-phosphate synthase
MTLPDCFIDHDKYETMLARAQLDAPSIVAKVLETLGHTKSAARVQIA